MFLSKKFISATEQMSDLNASVPAPYIRKNVNIDKPIKKAELTVCGLGFYRFWLNENEMTKGFLSPFISNPDDILDYDAYDLTDKLLNGNNILAFQLGNGMQNAFGGFVWDFQKAEFRSAPKMACCLNIEYEDGQREIIEADESFLCHPSPILRDDLRMGELYDANMETKNWNGSKFDDSSWRNALKASTPKGKQRLCTAKPIITSAKLHPVSIQKGEWIPGVSKTHHTGYIYDFGINTAGTVTLKINGTRGQRIKLTFGELMHGGKFYTDNVSFIREEWMEHPDYVQQVEYICKGNGTEYYRPSFTYFGFRYVFVEGLFEEQVTKELLTYNVMHTELPEAGNFKCSCEVLNKLQGMTRNATLSNFWHFPTDCPHREKNGWTADAALSVEHTLLNLDAENNYVEWQHHLCAAQDERGALPGIVPTAGWGFRWGNGPAWDQVIAEIPYQLYRYRGNVDSAKESIYCLYKYVRYLYSRKNERGLLAIGLGDWCAPEGVKAPLEFTDSTVTLTVCEKTSFLAKLAGRTDVADYCDGFADEIRENIRKHLIDLDTCIVSGECQSSQAMAIYYDIFKPEEKPRAFEVLLEYIKRQRNHLDTGVLGARVIFHVLAEFGYIDLAYDILTDPTPPSYAYWIEKGYTALAEDMWTDDKKIASKNHHFWGDISAFFIKRIAGIDYNPYINDLSFVKLSPSFPKKLDYAEAYHKCSCGMISASWKRKGNKIVFDATIPENIRYTVVLPIGYKEISRKAQADKLIVEIVEEKNNCN